MTDQPNYWQEVFDIFVTHKGNPKGGVAAVREKGGEHLNVAVTFGGMFLMIMAAHGYKEPKEVWDAVADYEDMRNS